MAALKLKNTATGRTVGVNERRYAQLIQQSEWEDDGSTALFDAMPLPPKFPKREELVGAGLRTVADVEEAGLDAVADLDGIGKTTAKKIVKAVKRGSLESE